MPFKLNINGNRTTQSNWDEVTNLYNEHCDANAMNDDDGCIYDFPASINTFISSKVPWKYQNVKMNTVKNNGNNKKLRMIRVWASMGSYMEDLLEIPEGGTVAGAFEITGLYYNDGKVILWDPTQPPEEASLGTRWREEANEEDPRIDDAHLDVMLFRMPRTIFIEDKYGKQITVQGTVRQVLQTIYESGYLRENYSGLIRTLEEALENSTTYIITSKDIGVTMSPERAKWQRKIKNIVGIEGTLNVMSYGAGQNRGRVSVYNDPTEIATESPANRSKAIDARRQNLNAYIQNKFRNYKNVDLGQGLVLKAEKPSATNKTWTNERLRSKKQWGHMNFNTSVENMIDTYRWKPSKYNEHSGPDPKQYECTLKNNFWKKDCPRYLKNTRNAYLNKERKEVENYSKKSCGDSKRRRPQSIRDRVEHQESEKLFHLPSGHATRRYFSVTSQQNHSETRMHGELLYRIPPQQQEQRLLEQKLSGDDSQGQSSSESRIDVQNIRKTQRHHPEKEMVRAVVKSTRSGARTHDQEIKSLSLYRLSYPGKRGQSIQSSFFLNHFSKYPCLANLSGFHMYSARSLCNESLIFSNESRHVAMFSIKVHISDDSV